ncbi:hypothetical protein PNEG_03290 [Pneumocystis murina B123]|uniref:TFIID subunit TAF5 NTD2 domain-containing protein n=1 Tax=Pneumocystis murina (strain B123) TaxID=1069680 RepID=M7NML2_PNEMU|nr:hypothetical protein PNEG_03290 [Pneumocystis murina B123]EMR08462.1 hypothetical protein PNEG_03290 [Pneumocystis murina B123]
MPPVVPNITQQNIGRTITIEDMNRLVMNWLSQHGYARTEAILRLESARGPEALNSAKNSLDWLNGNEDTYFQSYMLLRDWIDSSLELYRPELRRVLFPIFIHSYLDLISKNQINSAKQFFNTYSSEHEVLHGHDIRQISSITLPEHIEENELVKLYRQNKYRITMWRTAFDLMLHFLFENESNGGAIIMRLLNQHIETKIVTGRPDQFINSVVTNDEGISGYDVYHLDNFNKQPVKLGEMPLDTDLKNNIEIELASLDNEIEKTNEKCNKSFLEEFKNKKEISEDSPMKNSIPLPTFKGIDVEKEIEVIKDLRKRLILGPQASLPSVCMYTFHNTHDSLNCADISENASLIACGFSESYIRVWNTSINKTVSSDSTTPNDSVLYQKSHSRRFIGHSGPVYGIAFSNDNRFILSCSEDRSCRLWSLDTNTCLVAYKGHNQPIWDIAIGPFGHYFATASHDQTARLWSYEHMYPLRIFAGHLSDVDCVSFHPNSAYIATGSSDKTSRLWDVQKGSAVRVFTGHTGPINCVTISPDGKLLATAGDDGLINIYDIGLGKQLKSMKGHTRKSIYSLSFSKESSVLVSGGSDCTVRIWDVKRDTSNNKNISEISEGYNVETENNTLPKASTLTTKEKKENIKTPDHMTALYTCKTPVYKVQFTRRNLCLALSVSGVT